MTPYCHRIIEPIADIQTPFNRLRYEYLFNLTYQFCHINLTLKHLVGFVSVLGWGNNF